MNRNLFFILLFFSSQLNGQLILEDIFSSRYREKSPEHLNFMNDNNFYSVQQGSAIIKKRSESGETADTILGRTDTLLKGNFALSDFSFSAKETYLLLQGNRKAIYRRSFSADYLLYNVKQRKFQRIRHITEGAENKLSNVTISPNETRIAYTFNNNLYLYDLETGKIVFITTDGVKNEVINGSTDWVYEEEFEFVRAYEWSSDGKFLSYIRFDESRVPLYNMQLWKNELYPEDYRYKYPKAGENNALVSLHVYDIRNNKNLTISADSDNSYYIPRMHWKRDRNELLFLTLNRLQTKLCVYNYDLETNKKQIVISQQFPVSVELEQEIHFSSKNNSYFFSGKLFNADGILSYRPGKDEVPVLKTGDFDAEIDFIDEELDFVYYTSAGKPHERHCYRFDIKTGRITKLSEGRGTNHIRVSSMGRYYMIVNSHAGRPSVFTLYNAVSRKKIRVLEDNRSLIADLEKLKLRELEFLTLTTADTKLQAYLIKPPNFDSTKKYPVIIQVYGGPGSQRVTDAWGGGNYLYNQFLASQGYLIACVDNRGTGGRGTAFRTVTYGKLGELESQDVIEAAKVLSKISYVDGQKIGIWGWSFGGYLSSLCILKGNTVFKAGIAVAPVTSWRFYDTIYTERYLGLPKDNTEGYDLNSPLNYADRLQGKFLIIHGTADDNVHIQNTYAMISALNKAGKQYETILFPDKNHAISGGNTRLNLYRQMFEFWNRNLR